MPLILFVDEVSPCSNQLGSGQVSMLIFRRSRCKRGEEVYVRVCVDMICEKEEEQGDRKLFTMSMTKKVFWGQQ